VQFLCSKIDKPICRLPLCRLAVLPITAIAYFAVLDTGNRLIKMDYGQSAIRLVILPNHIKFQPIRALFLIADWLMPEDKNKTKQSFPCVWCVPSSSPGAGSG
jgi:hypothetical protein